MWTISEIAMWLAAALLACILSVPVYEWRAKRAAEKEMVNLLRRRT